ncbi:uracil phosphoribosyltransferase [Philodulcilactobacillus myokoensis]|uniref:Uracil phosphoribosyltransferase n=1 Tax=Philodulcilactobacillus myokoensis TaxID=2929573 RepID=A0A9W6B287_9LACO|nr:uracil phosphoribosyltransferase [Philodulcilactobacillus myokoensis]GLB47083.1 uracil phosphoribosyltransferase [Philodulcilactobacillus myokoensis]
MSNFRVMNHPLIQHKLTIIRNKDCGTKEFREVVNEISRLLAFEVSHEMPLKNVQVKTPMGIAKSKALAGKKVAIVPILRAGLGMLDGVLDLIPAAKVGFIGMYRDEKTFKPHEYFCKLPSDIADRQIFVIDPMLATGGTAIMTINALVQHGANPSNIKFVCIVAAPEGVKALENAHPKLNIYAAALDDHLENGYIVPGLGDAGDRLYGTK